MLQRTMNSFYIPVVVIWILLLMIHFGNSQEAAGATSLIHQCNSTIEDGQGILLSPNFPQDYNSNAYCNWHITVEGDQFIKLSFRHFELESSSDCEEDKVMVYDGPSRSHPDLGKFCGPFQPKDVITTSNRMLVTFQSDSRDEKSGFLAIFQSIAQELADPTSCGGLLAGSSHSIDYRKPNHPWSPRCVWHIRAPENYEILLRFSTVLLDVSIPSCIYDSITVFSGWTTRTETIYHSRFCRIGKTPYEIASQGNEMFVTFVTDSAFSGQGRFFASYTLRRSSLFNATLETSQSTIVLPTTSISASSTSTSTSVSTTTASTTSTEATCSCVEPSVSRSACSSRFVAVVRLMRLHNMESGAKRVVASLIKILKTETRRLPREKGSILFLKVNCPECSSFPTTYMKRSRYIIAGSDYGYNEGEINTEGYIQLYRRWLLRLWQKEIKLCKVIEGENQLHSALSMLSAQHNASN